MGLAMTTAPYGFRPLPHLFSLGVVGVATATVFFGLALLLLSPPPATESPADTSPSSPSTQALGIQEILPPASNDAASGSPSAPFADKAASPTTAAISEQKHPAIGAAALGTAFVPPPRSTRAKRVRIVRYHRPATPERHGAALWRPDARAGPHPGGGFYGPPNINVGYINPR
jgi:hypothetical protein